MMLSVFDIMFDNNSLFFKNFKGANKDDCMVMLDNDLADILSLDAGEVFVAGRYHSLIPLMQQLFESKFLQIY